MGALYNAPMSTPLRIATFETDVTPPIGAVLCFGYVQPAESVTDPLTCRGLVLLTEPQPIVLCAIDWLGIAHEGYTQWRSAIAEAVGTSASRVFLHTVHQHNATAYDPDAAAMFPSNTLHDEAHVRQALRDVAAAARSAMQHTLRVTHLTAGAAKVKKVASNRRILIDDGKIARNRMSACRDASLRAEPEGLIDPLVRVVGLWDGDTPMAKLSWYATHPQSFYNDGKITWDFPGIARAATVGMPHLHFTGAAGDIAAGKYNDGSPENRPVLAQRLTDGIAAAWDAGLADRGAVDADTFTFRSEPVLLPLSEARDWDEQESLVRDTDAPFVDRCKAARILAWRKRCQKPIELTALHGAGVSIINLPGEPSIEYQLAATAMRPDDLVCVAAYGDYSPSYICAEAHYAQGGYEATTSYTSPKVERVLLDALRTLMA